MPSTPWWIRLVVILGLWAMLKPFVRPPEKPVEEAVIAPAAKLPAAVSPVPDFSRIRDVKEKKRRFFAYLRPEIERQNAQIKQTRKWLLKLQQDLGKQRQLAPSEHKKLKALAKRYKVDAALGMNGTLEELLLRVDVVPVALVLVQAANESGWGTSRFARQGFNFFGLWCFKPGCGFVPKRRGDGKVHEVARFNSLSHAVRTYLLNLNRHYAYAELRAIRARLRTKSRPLTAERLVEGLMQYSIRGQDYIDELKAMLRVNKPLMRDPHV